ncbi:MAG: alanine/glycine:cation symporter family protein [Pseudomonadales bacterium]
MDAFNNLLLMMDRFLGGAVWFPYLLLGTGLFFTLYLGVPQVRYFGRAWKVLRHGNSEKGAEGDTSHYQALTTALSGTVGTGNIGGVGLAIYLGGPAALFWMWATAFFGMTTKFVEVSLSHKYREKTEDGTMAGGPMYFMDKGLNMKPVAVMFAMAAVLSSFGSGSLPQINNIAQAMNSTFGIDQVVTGAVASVCLGMVIIGGIKRIASFTAKVVPTMAVLYLIGAAGVIFANLENIAPSFYSIFRDAFTGSAATGGFLGATFAYVFNRGVNRGLYSNEAGQGSAPIAHASARSNEPVSEGLVSLLEPFIDTIIICTITGLVILSSGVWIEKFENTFQRTDLLIVEGVYTDDSEEARQGLFKYLSGLEGHGVTPYTGELDIQLGEIRNSDVSVIHARSIAENVLVYVSESRADEPVLFSGPVELVEGRFTNGDIVLRGDSLIHSAALTTEAFTRGYFGDYGKYIVAIALALFAFSTSVSWSYYGDRAMIYLVGQRGVMPYRVVYVIAFFFAAFSDTSLIWNIATVTVVLMTIPNVICILLMRKEVKGMVDSYIERH